VRCIDNQLRRIGCGLPPDSTEFTQKDVNRHVAYALAERPDPSFEVR
jgi:hypothetical protein